MNFSRNDFTVPTIVQAFMNIETTTTYTTDILGKFAHAHAIYNVCTYVYQAL